MRGSRSLEGWDFRAQYGRLKLIANNSRFLILPHWHRPNVGSRVLALTARRIVGDWQVRFGHRLLLLETFVDLRRFHGGVYRAANWIELGLTQGYRRTRQGYSEQAEAPKRVFVRALCRNPQVLLTHPDRTYLELTGGSKIMLTAQLMRTLPDFFNLETAVERCVQCVPWCAGQGAARRNSELFRRVATPPCAPGDALRTT